MEGTWAVGGVRLDPLLGLEGVRLSRWMSMGAAEDRRGRRSWVESVRSSHGVSMVGVERCACEGGMGRR